MSVATSPYLNLPRRTLEAARIDMLEAALRRAFAGVPGYDDDGRRLVDACLTWETLEDAKL